MKLVFLPSNYTSLGGTEVYVHHLAEALVRTGHEVVVAFHAGKSAKPLFAESNYRVHPLPALRDPTRAELYGHSLGEPPGFRAFIEKETPDVLHFHSFSLGAGVDHARLAKSLGIPYYVTYHIPGMSCPRGNLKRWGNVACDGVVDVAKCSACLLQKMGIPRPFADLLGRSPIPVELVGDGPHTTRLALPGLLHAGTKTWREFLENSGGIVACAEWCKDVLVANGIDEAKISVRRQALPGASRTVSLRVPRNGRPRLGYLGRITPDKGAGFAIEISTALGEAGIDHSFEIVGAPEDNSRSWFEAILARSPAVSALGAKSPAEAKRWLAGLDLLLVPSRGLETGPLTVLEAWESGTPVVGTNLGGIREFLAAAGMDSLLFTDGDVAEAVAAVRRALRGDGMARQVTIPGMTELAAAMASLYESTPNLRRVAIGE